MYSPRMPALGRSAANASEEIARRDKVFITSRYHRHSCLFAGWAADLCRRVLRGVESRLLQFSPRLQFSLGVTLDFHKLTSRGGWLFSLERSHECERCTHECVRHIHIHTHPRFHF